MHDTITVTAFGITITATPLLITTKPTIDGVDISGRYLTQHRHLTNHWEVTILDAVTRHASIGDALGEIIDAIRYFTYDEPLNTHASAVAYKS